MIFTIQRQKNMRCCLKILIKLLLKNALTEKINDVQIYMKAIDTSYSYDVYNVFKTEELFGNNN